MGRKRKRSYGDWDKGQQRLKGWEKVGRIKMMGGKR